MGIIGSYQGYSDSPLYLYNKGVWSNLQTTGISSTAGTCSDSYNMLSSRPTAINSTSAARFNQTVNLAGYNYLKCDLSVGYGTSNSSVNSAYIGISTSPTITSLSGLSVVGSVMAYGETQNRATVIANITNFNECYYIYLMCSTSSTMKGEAAATAYSIFLTTI